MITFVEMKDVWERDFVKSKLAGQNVLFFNETVQERIKDLSETELLSVFVNSRVDRDLILKMPKLKCIFTRSTGFDHIDLKTAKEKNIAVYNVPVYGENTVAEHTFALMLSLSRNLREAYSRSMKNDFSIEGLMGFDLKGKTLGVIGTGHIGLHVIRMALGFGMKVVAFDIKQQTFLSEVLNFEYVPLEELLKRSDIISLHAPYNPATRHLINKKNIALIKKGAVLINTARGGLIETDALVEALDKKILRGAGLDVLEEEEYLLTENQLLKDARTEADSQRLQTISQNRSLLNRENVIYTPHLAFYSYEAVERILETTINNIASFKSSVSTNRV